MRWLKNLKRNNMPRYSPIQLFGVEPTDFNFKKMPSYQLRKSEKKICKSCKLFGIGPCNNPRQTICDNYKPKRKK